MRVGVGLWADVGGPVAVGVRMSFVDERHLVDSLDLRHRLHLGHVHHVLDHGGLDLDETGGRVGVGVG